MYLDPLTRPSTMLVKFFIVARIESSKNESDQRYRKLYVYLEQLLTIEKLHLEAATGLGL